MSNYSIAVDIGGTFTDVVLRHRDGRFWVDKTLTTAEDLKQGFFTAIKAVLTRADCRADQVDDVIVHATTIVTNAIIERKAPPVALLVTEGFRDVLAIRDECRSDIFDNQLEVPKPLVPGELTFAVPERMLSDGGVVKEVDRAAVQAIARRLVELKIESVAVCLLNSYKNPANERLVRHILTAEASDIFVSLSSDIAPQMREYPRASTTALNAYTVPIVKPYLDALQEGLSAAGFRQELLIMLSSGGVIGAGVAGLNPVRMIESGPAAGALAASFYAKLLSAPDLLSFDMGGTTAKACFIQNGQPLITTSFEVDRIYRFQQGSGFPVTVPCIDMIEIGAGGGSLADTDSLGLLTVGPQSAGSWPGPVCYRHGGTCPTVTDADLILGMLDANNFLGGEMRLDVEGARKVLEAFGKGQDLGAEDMALGIYEVVGESMASAVRAHATDRGVDWRGIPLLAFGGAGPVHACHVAELLDSRMVIYPLMASVLSAFGALVTPLRLDLFRSDVGLLRRLDWSLVDRHISQMIDEARAALLKAGCAKNLIRITIGGDFRYQGQHNELTIMLALKDIEARQVDSIRATFEAEYQKTYGIKLENLDVEVVAWRVTAYGPEIDQKTVHMAAGAQSGRHSRSVRFHDGAHDTPVIPRASLRVGEKFPGPAIIEERETTIVILPGWEASVDPHGCIFATRQGA
ncbi:MAG: hydantoinase/oxoprolinase family protein [Alphaproteobacteria bacterium]|nr:hydantoinase/oxoprolinase family protein [Alphaproteobacteria bacterium]